MSDRELFHRHPGNPILTASDWPYPVNAVFNPAAVRIDGTTILLARVEDMRGISHLTVARSANGFDNWSVAAEPLLEPLLGIESEVWGFEDARTVWVEELGRFVITCTAYGPAGPAVYLATTQDFASVERHGIVVTPEDKNAAILPERVGGEWILLRARRPCGRDGPVRTLIRSAMGSGCRSANVVLKTDPREGRPASDAAAAGNHAPASVQLDSRSRRSRVRSQYFRQLASRER
jgi:predicted GH43/DUF377 family glycosyl hydrolase